MITLNSKLALTKRVNKHDLNQLATSRYGEGVYCEHVRSGKRGWYLNKNTEQTFLGVNANEAFSYLKSQKTVMKMSAKATLVIADAVHTEKLVKQSKTAIEPVISDNTVKPGSVSELESSSISPEDLLEQMMEKFPNTFFREVDKIRPLQRHIHKKIRHALNDEYTKNEISAALTLYTQTVEYCQKMLEEKQRIDLAGNVCEEVSLRHVEDAKARLVGKSPMRPTKKEKTKIPRSSPQPSPQLEQLVCGNMELCVKVNELPSNSKTLKNGWEEFIIETKTHQVKIKVRPKTWKKLQNAAREYSLWVANIRGKMGNRVKGGFELLRPGVQIFEKETIPI